MLRVCHDELAELRRQNRHRAGNLSAWCAAPQDAEIIYTSVDRLPHPARCTPCHTVGSHADPPRIEWAIPVT